MISVSEAEQIILSQRKDYGVERVPFLVAQGRVLAEPVVADRDLPPYDRVTMDGIAIRYADYAAGAREFRIEAVQAAGDAPPSRLAANACIEIMTGAVCSSVADTVIPYEHLHIRGAEAHVTHEPVMSGQNIHRRGRDRQQGEVLVPAGRLIGPAEINVMASVGKTELQVRQLPRTVVFSSGDELVDVTETPLPYQVRRSNNYTVYSTLRRYGIETDMLHLPDNLDITRDAMERCLREYDSVLLSGGVSMGKFDYLPQALEDSGVTRHFHKVRQRPGKPFWFGTYGERGVVFAFPGNPVSTFLCLHRYFLPWLEASLGLPPASPQYAVLDSDVHFEPPLQYFLQVKLWQDADARLHATPLEGNGSGDFANLPDADAFLELPAERVEFQEGEAFRVIKFVSV